MSTDTEPEPTARPGALGPQELAILDIERGNWKYQGAKEQVIVERLGLSPTSYYQLLNALIDSGDAYIHDPMLIRRLQGRRISRSRSVLQRRLS